MRRILSTCLLALGLVVSTYAQEPVRPPDAKPGAPAGAGAQQKPPDAPRPPAATGADAKAITVTGCVAGGPAAFTLSNAMAATKPGDSAVGTSGISSSYDLTASAGVDLSSHVGHKVEVTGTPMAASGSAAPSAGAGKPPAPKLTVTAVKMVSTSCS
jgi:hypothetical protein